MRYSQIRSMDISNGEGIGVSLFVQGCDFHCKNCFNQSTWDWEDGKEFTEKEADSLMKLCKPHYISRLSILGGEPLNPKNITVVTEISKRFKELYPDKKLWIWTGYQFTEIEKCQVLNFADFIIDGQFIDLLKDFSLKYRGSSNQNLYEKTKNGWRTKNGQV